MIAFRFYIAQMSWRGRWSKIVIVSMAIICIFANLEFARTNYQNGDNVQSYNELSGLLVGNWLLHGWSLTSDNYYFTDLPFYVVCGSIFGYRPALIFIVPLVVFVNLLLACVLIVRHMGKTEAQRDFGSIGILWLLGFPFTPLHQVLLQSATHTATITICCWGFYFGQLFLARHGAAGLFLFLFCITVFAVSASDPQAFFYFLGSLPILVIVRFWFFGRLSREECLLAGFALAASGFGMEIVPYIAKFGGFEVVQNYSLDFLHTLPDFARNILAYLRALRIAFDAEPALIGVPYGCVAIALSRSAIMIGCVLLCVHILWRMPLEYDRGLAQWLVFASILLSLADVTSGTFARVAGASAPGLPVFAVRFVTPIYVCIILAAVIECQAMAIRMAGCLAPRVAGSAVGVLAAIYGVGICQATFRAATMQDFQKTAPQYQLAVWLRAHDLTYGVGDYWTAQTVTAWGYGQVTEDPVAPVSRRLIAYRLVGDMSRLDAGKPPQFVAFMPINQYHITLNDVIVTYGQPKAVIKLDGVVLAILR